jgi:hypothetical protein
MPKKPPVSVRVNHTGDGESGTRSDNDVGSVTEAGISDEQTCDEDYLSGGDCDETESDTESDEIESDD